MERNPADKSALDATLAHIEHKPAMAATVAAPTMTRSTVLPRMAAREGAPSLVVDGVPRYQELQRLGTGGQAEVTLTRDHDIDRRVAVKRLLPEHSEDVGAVLRFTEEIRTVGQLEHPNIVPIHDVGVDPDGHYFFVMKYVEGETLETIIAKLRDKDPEYLRRYTPEYRLQICNEILRGVEHAHALGVLHRDLKPGNVMIGSLGEVVVMDWGLAKRIHGADAPAAMTTTAEKPGATRPRLFETQAGALLGTPAYMAPEQAAGKLDALDVRTDVYSLSVMFYEFLSLRHPRVQHQTVAEMIAAIIEDPIERLQTIADFGMAGMPATLAHFVRHGLERDPAARYQSVTAMRERLESVRDGKAPIECHVTFTQRLLAAAARSANRHPMLLALMYVVILAAIITGGVDLVRALLR